MVVVIVSSCELPVMHSNDIHAELDAHTSLLSDIDDGVNKTNSQLKVHIKKVDSVVAEQDGCLGLCIIFFLILVIILCVKTPQPHSMFVSAFYLSLPCFSFGRDVLLASS